MAGQIKLTISIDNGAVVITADDGKKGGNVRSRSLRRIVWERDTGSVDSFDLTFERLGEAEGAMTSVADFPLIEVKTVPGNVSNEDAGKVTGAHRVSGRLAEVGIYKYSVTAKKGGSPTTLDPIIIIEE